jgi:hypothetical protein
MKYTTNLATALRRVLFKQSTEDFKVRYTPKNPECAAKAAVTWAVHGVCHRCRCQSITVGRCADCGMNLIPPSASDEERQDEVRGQLRRATDYVKESKK